MEELKEKTLFFALALAAIVASAYISFSSDYELNLLVVAVSVAIWVGVLIIQNSWPVSDLLDNTVGKIVAVFAVSVLGYLVTDVNPRYAVFALLGMGLGMLFYGFMRYGYRGFTLA